MTIAPNNRNLYSWITCNFSGTMIRIVVATTSPHGLPIPPSADDDRPTPRPLSKSVGVPAVEPVATDVLAREKPSEEPGEAAPQIGATAAPAEQLEYREEESPKDSSEEPSNGKKAARRPVSTK